MERRMEKQLTGVRVEVAVGEQRHRAQCNLFLESYGPPPRWRGRLWDLSPNVTFKKGARLTLTLPQGSSGEATIQRVAVRGAYDFQGEGLPPAF